MTHIPFKSFFVKTGLPAAARDGRGTGSQTF